MLEYLSDTFSEIKKLDLGLQNNFINFLKCLTKSNLMIRKLNFWETCITKNQPEIFDALHSFLSANELNLSKKVKYRTMAHIKELKMSFR